MERITPTRTYEFLFLASGSLTRDAAQSLAQNLMTIIKAEGGETLETHPRHEGAGVIPNEHRTVGAVEAPGQAPYVPFKIPVSDAVSIGRAASPLAGQERLGVALEARRLAYPIQKELNGTLGTIAFRAAPPVLRGLQEALRRNPALLRYCITKKRLRRKRSVSPKPSASRFAPLFGTSSAEPTRLGYPPDTHTPLSSPQAPAAPDVPPITPADIDRKLEEIIG